MEEQRSVTETFAEALEVAVGERGKFKGNRIQALDREIESEAAAIQEFLGAIQEREHALSLHGAMVEAAEKLELRDAGWHKKEVERLDNEVTAAEQRVKEMEPSARDHLERIRNLRRVRKAISGTPSSLAR